MQMLMIRRWLTEKTTIGELFINPIDEGNRGFQCYTLEDRYLGDEVKDPGKSCIPCGIYTVEMRYSPKFRAERPVIFNEKLQVIGGWRYLIHSPERKVQFENCMFHEGNDAGDTLGCPIVGRERGSDRVDFSRPALTELLQRLRYALGKNEPLHLTIKMQ